MVHLSTERHPYSNLFNLLLFETTPRTKFFKPKIKRKLFAPRGHFEINRCVTKCMLKLKLFGCVLQGLNFFKILRFIVSVMTVSHHHKW